MKKIEAIIRKSKFKEVKKALINGGFNSFNYRLTRCISEQSETRFYRGVKFDSKAKERISLSIYVKDQNTDAVVDLIKKSGKTGDADDSYLIVLPVNEAFKLKDGDESDKLIRVT